MLEQLGMTKSDLRKRHKMLQEVRARIVATTVGKPRTVLAKPQPLYWLHPTVAAAAAVDDRSTANDLNTAPYATDRPYQPTVVGIGHILRS